jgi:uncharacterized membrane protein YphA (DoxX/SURF4 family)
MLSRYFGLLMVWWKSYWFPETTGRQLAICRIMLVTAQLLFFFPSLDSQLMFVQPFRGFIDAQVIIVVISNLLPAHLFPTAWAFTAIYWTTLATGITTLIGFLTRTSAFVFALGNWILVAHVYSYGEDHHPEAILCFFLMLLAFSPSGRCLSMDALIDRYRLRSENDRGQSSPEKIDTAVWPLKLTQLLLCFAYVSTGLAKLVYGGLAWMNSYTLQQIIFGSAISRDIPLGVWLAQQHTLCVFLSVGVILFEVFFFVALILPKTLPYFLLGGSPFFQYIVLYVVFLDFDKWFARARNLMRNTRYGEDAVERSRMAAPI